MARPITSTYYITVTGQARRFGIGEDPIGPIVALLALFAIDAGGKLCAIYTNTAATQLSAQVQAERQAIHLSIVTALAGMTVTLTLLALVGGVWGAGQEGTLIEEWTATVTTRSARVVQTDTLGDLGRIKVDE